jgi:hypothetical protein
MEGPSRREGKESEETVTETAVPAEFILDVNLPSRGKKQITKA